MMALAMSMGMAVYTAVIASGFFSATLAVWGILATFLVIQTTRGTPLRQSIHYFLIIAAALIVVSLLNLLNLSLVAHTLFAFFFVLSGYIAFLHRPLSRKAFFHIMLFSMVVLIAGFAPSNGAMMSDQIAGVALGTLLGIFSNHCFFPIKLQDAFFEGIVPILKALHAFTLAPEKEKSPALLFQQNMYPEWVYEAGFNPGLRASWRFFLVNIERVTEICFSLNYLMKQGRDFHTLLDPMSALQKNAELIDILTHYFEKNEFKKTDSDYTSDMESLEADLQKIVPRHIEAIDLAPEFLILTAIVRDIRDMRGILLQLVKGLPA